MAAALMDGELGTLLKVSAAVWAAMWYARTAAARIGPGAVRLAALLPAVVLLSVLPLSFATTTFRGSSAFFLSWLGTFKLFLLAAGRGPLDPSLPLLQFVCSASLPVKLREKSPTAAAAAGKNSKKHKQDPAPASAKKILVAGAVIPFIIYAYQYKESMSRWQLLLLYTVHIYLSLDLLLATVHAVIHGALGMEMEPQTDRPYLASSLREFWGRRWNLMVPAILRPSVYGPVRARCGSDAAAVMACFLVSGLMHELIFYYLMWRPPTGEVTAFFLLQGVCAGAEAWWGRHAGWWRPPRAVATPLTLAFVGGTGFWLFFPAMVRGGLDELVQQECQGMVALMEQAARWLAGAGPVLSTR